DLAHQGTDRGAALEYALAGIVTLADHAYHLAVLGDRERPDVVLSHLPQCIEYSVLRIHRMDLLDLLGLDYLSHSLHSMLLFICRAIGQQGSAVSSRSEEHTSELESRENLVCRLLLEK